MKKLRVLWLLALISINVQVQTLNEAGPDELTPLTEALRAFCSSQQNRVPVTDARELLVGANKKKVVWCKFGDNRSQSMFTVEIQLRLVKDDVPLMPGR